MTTSAGDERCADTAPSGCPFHLNGPGTPSSSADVATPAGVDQDDILVVAHPKRMVAQYLTEPAGSTLLHLFYGDKEITFDEPATYAFGERLASESRFRAGDAAAWGDRLSWARTRAMLDDLIDAGVLTHAADAAPERFDSMVRPSPLPAATCLVPRSWRDCEAITAELAGRPVESGYLELVVPVFRVAHISVDGDGRQVGEANVFPAALRLDAPTTWIGCSYSGTRHMVNRPMNVSALKAMRLHWKTMMATLLRLRTAFLRRDRQPANVWTVGRVERLATLVLAVPTFQLMANSSASATSTLHPALSSLFRVTDGLRMTMHQMLFVPIGEPARHPDAIVTPESIFEYAERNYSFHSETGVCAGPGHMIQEFLRVLLNGEGDERYGSLTLPVEVEAALADIEPAFDYGLYGLQIYAASFSLWPAMARAYDELGEAAERITGIDPRLSAIRARLAQHASALHNGTYLATEEWRQHRETVYADMYARCGGLLSTPHADAPLSEQLASPREDECAEARSIVAAALRGAVAAGAASANVGDGIDAIADGLCRFLARSRNVLAASLRVQSRINRLLGRPAPQRAFTLADADVHNRLQAVDRRPVPFLLDELQALFDLDIHVDASRIDVTHRSSTIG